MSRMMNCQPVTQHPRWRTTPYRQYPIAKSIHSQLPFKSTGYPAFPQPEDATYRGDIVTYTQSALHRLAQINVLKILPIAGSNQFCPFLYSRAVHESYPPYTFWPNPIISGYVCRKANGIYSVSCAFCQAMRYLFPDTLVIPIKYKISASILRCIERK